MITQERLKELLNYDPNTGIFTWIKPNTQSVHIGDQAGCIQPPRGYRRICVDRKYYLAHRLAWLYVYGRWPTNIIDHIDESMDNNRIANLQDITHIQNIQRVTKKRKTNSTGFVGVYYDKRKKKYCAQIGHNYKHTHLGLFNTAEEASIAYQQAKLQLHFNH